MLKIEVEYNDKKAKRYFSRVTRFAATEHIYFIYYGIKRGKLATVKVKEVKHLLVLDEAFHV